MLFGGRRATVVPLVYEARDWEHGVFLGSTCPRRRPPPRPEPSASCASTRWRCCRSAATTWPTTSATGSRSAAARAPSCRKVFYVNWFRKDDDGKFLWPGFGENSRVLAWMFRRCEGTADAVETAIGLVPPLGEGGIDTTGLEISDEAMDAAARGRPRGLDSSSCRRCTSTTRGSATGCPPRCARSSRRSSGASAPDGRCLPDQTLHRATYA